MMSAPGTAAKTEQAGFGMAEFLRVVETRRPLILKVAAGVVALAILVLLTLPAVYTASAVVMLDQRKNNITEPSQILSDLPTDAASLQNQIAILTSRDLAAEVIGKEKLYDDSEFNPALNTSPLAGVGDLLHPSKWLSAPASATDEDRDAIIDAVLSHLRVDAEGVSTTFTVSFFSRDPQKAARIANAFVAAYVDDQLRSKYEAAQKTTQWLTGRVNQLAKQVEADEAAVQAYKAKNNLNEAADGVSLVDQQMAGINTQIVAARSDLAQKEAIFDRVKDLVASGHAADVSQAVSSPVIVALRGQEATLIQQEADFAARYGPKHPKMIAAQQQQRDLETKISQEVDRIAGSLANDVDVARANVNSLEASLAGAERAAGVENFAKVNLKSLEANAASTRSMYEAFVTRLRETQDQEAIQLPDARVLSPAPVPGMPSSPKRMLIFAASIPAGLLLGLLAALLAERFGGETQIVRRYVPVRPAPVAPPRPAPVRAPVLAQVPDASVPRAADYVIDWPQSAFAQSLTSILQRLASPQSGTRPKIVGVTAAAPGIGKTNVAMGLARIASRAGWRVVMVDGDLASATMARAAGYDRVQGGIIEALSRKLPLSRSFVKDPRTNVLMLCASQPVSNSTAFAQSPAMAQLMAHLRQTADLVIVDCPPAHTGADARAIAQNCDAMLMVVHPQHTPAASVDAALRTVGPARTGLVLAG